MPSITTFAPYKLLGLFFTLEFNIVVLSPKIDIICCQNVGELWGTSAEFWYRYVTLPSF